MTAAPCRVVEQESLTPCVWNTSYGCVGSSTDAEVKAHVWVKGGCRAVFACGEAARVSCGGYKTRCSCRASRGPRPRSAATAALLAADHRIIGVANPLLVGTPRYATSSASQESGLSRSRHGMGCRPYRVWMGTQVHAADVVTWEKVRAAADDFLSSTPRIVTRVTVNLWGGLPLPTDAKNTSDTSGEPQLQIVSYDGARSYYWWRVFTPDVVASFDYLWLTDADMEIAPALFPLSHLVHVAAVTGVNIIQPSVTSMRGPRCQRSERSSAGGCDALSIKLAPGTRATDWPHLRSRKWFGDCLVQMTTGVEAMSLLFRAAAWALIHDEVLQPKPRALLKSTSFGISNTYCELVRHGLPGRRPCAVARHITMIHADTRDMDTHHLTQERRSPVGATGWQHFAPALPAFLMYCLSAANLSAMASAHRAEVAALSPPLC